jgi:hypothetical protein
VHHTKKRRVQAYRKRQAMTTRDCDDINQADRFMRGALIACVLGGLFWLTVGAIWLAWPRMQAAAGIP